MRDDSARRETTGAGREALEAAEHELTTLDSLTVTDRPDAVADALQRGDLETARKMTWETDTGPVIRQIEKALRRAVDGGEEAD